jgi:hypothetical protein
MLLTSIMQPLHQVVVIEDKVGLGIVDLGRVQQRYSSHHHP